MSKKGKRLREFEKNNREFSVRPMKPKSGTETQQESVDGSKVAKETRKKKKKTVVNIKRLVISTMICVFIVFVGVSAIKLINLQNEYDDLLARKVQLEMLKEELTAELEYVDSDEYIEQQARRNLKLIMENEILFILPDEADLDEEDTEDGQA